MKTEIAPAKEVTVRAVREERTRETTSAKTAAKVLEKSPAKAPEKTIQTTQDTKMQTIARRIMLGICWFNGILAPIFGILMILSPQGELLQMQELLVTMQTWPGASIFFQDLVWPGIALLCVNGVSNLVCLALWLSRKRAYTGIGIICGLLLIAWCTWEMIFIPNGVTVFYMLLGIVQTGAAVYCTAMQRA